MKNILKPRFLLILGAILLFALALVLSNNTEVLGRQQEKITICHVPPGNINNAQTLNLSPQALNGHLVGDTDQLHGLDYYGECQEDTQPVCEKFKKGLQDEDLRNDFVKTCQISRKNFLICERILNACEINVCRLFPDIKQCEEPKVPPQDVCDNIDGVQSETPDGYTNDNGFCFVPEPEPQPEPTITVTHNSPSPAGPPPVCNGTDIDWAPTITEVGRIDHDTIYARWTKVADHIDDYIVWYGLSENNLQWATKVENSEYTEITLPDYPNQHVWLNVAGTDNCIVGPASITIDP